MRVSAAGNMPLQGLVKPPAKPVVMILAGNLRKVVCVSHTLRASFGEDTGWFALFFGYRNIKLPVRPDCSGKEKRLLKTQKYDMME